MCFFCFNDISVCFSFVFSTILVFVLFVSMILVFGFVLFSGFCC